MKILVVLFHPAHVHNFRNTIKELENRKHVVKVLAIKKDITLKLLDSYDMEYQVIGQSGSNQLYTLFLNYLTIAYNILKTSKIFKPDIFLTRSGLPLLPTRYLLRRPVIAFKDSEIRSFITKFEINDVVFTPSSFHQKIKSDMHLKLPTYKELAYLHPDRFIPDELALRDLGIELGEKFSLLRFSGYDAWHDVGQHGFDYNLKVKLVKNLEHHGEVYVSSEKELPKKLKKYQLNVPIDKIHDVLYHANLFVGDSQTMTTESAVLGTPAIRCSSFAGENDMTNFVELENKYGLIYNYREPEKAIKKATELIQRPDLKEEWAKKREKLLKDKIDLSAFLTWFIDNYPESVDQLKEDQDIIWDVTK